MLNLPILQNSPSSFYHYEAQCVCVSVCVEGVCPRLSAETNQLRQKLRSHHLHPAVQPHQPGMNSHI